jgi:glycosyltransferase involved in cell wall biosynthesis
VPTVTLPPHGAASSSRTREPFTAEGAQSRLRIAIVAPCWVPVPPPRYGGTELVLDTLARGLAAAGHDVTLVTTGDATCPVPRIAATPLALGTDDATPLNETVHVLEGYARLGEVDIVHDHTLVGPLVAPRYTSAPVVTTNHAPFTGTMATYFRHLARSVPVIAISHAQAALAEGIRIAAVIHHGIDVDAIPLGSGSGGYALFLGRMSPDKGVVRAIEVARRAGVPLRIAAKMREPAEQAYFSEVVRPLLGSDVEYVGEVGGRTKQDLLGGALALVNPIAWPEPFGMVMIEAMAAGTPVVATPNGSAPELVAHGTSGFIAADTDELATSLLRAATLDRTRVRAWAAEHFSAQRMVENHLRLYRRVIDEHSRLGTLGRGA